MERVAHSAQVVGHRVSSSRARPFRAASGRARVRNSRAGLAARVFPERVVPFATTSFAVVDAPGQEAIRRWAVRAVIVRCDGTPRAARRRVERNRVAVVAIVVAFKHDKTIHQRRDRCAFGHLSVPELQVAAILIFPTWIQVEKRVDAPHEGAVAVEIRMHFQVTCAGEKDWSRRRRATTDGRINVDERT